MTHRIISPKTYVAVFIALLVLLALTVLASHIENSLVNNTVAMTIATVKTVLIMLYFMHLRFSSRLTQAFALAGFLWLAILLGLTISDYRTREPEPIVPSAERGERPLLQSGPLAFLSYSKC